MKRNREELERHRQLKREYRELFDQMCEILYRIDPMGIGVTVDNPHKDEYSVEVNRILSGMVRASSQDEALQIARDVFNRYFEGCRWSDDALRQAIQEIWDTHQRFQASRPNLQSKT